MPLTLQRQTETAIMEKGNYLVVRAPINSSLYAVQNEDRKWGVVDEEDNVVVEFGKYDWIDGFHNGLAKVIGRKDTTSPNTKRINIETGEVLPDRVEQGVINEDGQEVIDMEEGYVIWKFYGKDYPTIVAVRDGIQKKFTFEELKQNFVADDEEEELSPF